MATHFQKTNIGMYRENVKYSKMLTFGESKGYVGILCTVATFLYV